ncbi:peptidylprolyl isomerase [Nocardioides sp. AE5]|uniref:peptidylprolyl isomerase n=1 Tax=Nocardioides sp. AE5 TaxID=2962573 RepID=UPI0028823D69|nr:peptidylprolyl isomerase [Nocardioides sp. AE5]MDT0201450.1 peptidylprolyl isomerase [Nocardioides sp. AE5]
MLKRTLAALAAASLLTLAACGSDDDSNADGTPSPTPSASSPEASSPEPSADASADASSGAAEPGGTCEYVASPGAAREVNPPPATPTHTGKVSATIKTNVGDIPITLHGDTAPCTVNSFISLAEQDFYDDTPCPRMGYQTGFAILQCGDPTGTGAGGPGYQFADELSGTETYPAGTIAMANAGPNTNGSQFFLVFADSGFPPNYTVFGTIDQAGIDLLLKVGEKGEDGSHPAGGGAPNQPVDFTDVVIND